MVIATTVVWTAFALFEYIVFADYPVVQYFALISGALLMLYFIRGESELGPLSSIIVFGTLWTQDLYDSTAITKQELTSLGRVPAFKKWREEYNAKRATERAFQQQEARQLQVSLLVTFLASYIYLPWTSTALRTAPWEVNESARALGVVGILLGLLVHDSIGKIVTVLSFVGLYASFDAEGPSSIPVLLSASIVAIKVLLC